MAANIALRDVNGFKDYMQFMKLLCPIKFKSETGLNFVAWTFEDNEGMGFNAKLMVDKDENPLCMLFFKGQTLVDGFVRDGSNANPDSFGRLLPKDQALGLRKYLADNGFKIKHNNLPGETILDPANGGELTHYTWIAGKPFDLCDPLPEIIPNTVYFGGEGIDMSKTRYVRGSLYASGAQFVHDTIDGIRFHDSDPTDLCLWGANIRSIDNVTCDQLRVGTSGMVVSIGRGVKCKSLHSFHPVILPNNLDVDYLIVPKNTQIPPKANIGHIKFSEDVKFIPIEEVVEHINDAEERKFVGPDIYEPPDSYGDSGPGI